MKDTLFWRLGVLLLALTLLFTAAGCKKKNKTEEDPEAAEASETEAPPDAAPAEPEPPDVKNEAFELEHPAEPEPEEPEPEGFEDLDITLYQAVSYINGLSPSVLGLEGDSMSEYEVIPKNYIVPVNGLLCSELMVYNKHEETGTNELVETVLITRGPERKVFRKDPDTKVAVELPEAGTSAPEPAEAK